MDKLTWGELRKILIDCGDSDALKENVIVRGSDGEWNLDLMVDAKAGTFAFNYGFEIETE